MFHKIQTNCESNNATKVHLFSVNIVPANKGERLMSFIRYLIMNHSSFICWLDGFWKKRIVNKQHFLLYRYNGSSGSDHVHINKKIIRRSRIFPDGSLWNNHYDHAIQFPWMNHTGTLVRVWRKLRSQGVNGDEPFSLLRQSDCKKTTQLLITAKDEESF